MTRGTDLIAAERERHIGEEGYDAEHDEGHELELTEASLSYLASLRHRWRYPDRRSEFSPTLWPWGLKFWKPTVDPVRQLVKAGALIAAAIDSLLPAEVEASFSSDPKGIRVTVEDLETGGRESRVIWDDYMLIVAGNRYLARASASKNGTHMLTVKRDGGDQ